MIQVLNEEFGEVNLFKFILILCDSIDGNTKNYDYFLNGYFYKWNFKYNRFTHHTNEEEVPHTDIIDSLSYELKKEFKLGIGIWGKTDCYPNGKTFFFCSPDDILTNEQIDYITRFPENVDKNLLTKISNKNRDSVWY